MALLPVGFEELKVSELWRDGRGWDLNSMAPYVTEKKRLELVARVVDNVTGSTDRMAWGETADGRFTVSSAYRLLTIDDSPKQNMEELYRRVWRARVPERVRVFMWLVVQQVIMTNNERFQRHLTDSNICQVCKGGVETIIHVLRDCPEMKGIWSRLVKPSRRRVFFETSLLGWIYENLRETNEEEIIPWATMFAIAVWWAWKWPCGNVFGENRVCRDRIRFLKDYAKEVVMATSTDGDRDERRERVERLISWAAPSVGWFKLNTDGASHGNPGRATAGGVIRDGEGNWCGGFALNIGICSAPLAELWGVYYGLYVAWEKRIELLELEVDSEMVFGFLRTRIGESHPLFFLVRLCHGFIANDWNVRISHVYREANRLADGLANYALSLPLGFHAFNSVPLDVGLILQEDVSGPPRPRQVYM